jgi:eukaryotic-like serine/threonine-protein kinase
MPFDPARAKALFLGALELPDPADRTGFLDRECGEDADLRRRVDQLLAAYDQPAAALESHRAAEPTGAFVDQSPVEEVERTASVAPEPASPDLIGSIIAGRYKLRQEIGEGGMGSVYLAEQLQPVKRQVALKLIKPGMDSRTVLARFESERQALALMDHPHIAKVLDAGTTEQGRPFFVMELVKGIPLTDYCDRHQLDLPTRLAIFRQICSAVQHAHQKGIIHRDLKPSNILVESHDGRPVPKVIDFGLAKATSGMQLSEHSLLTAFGTVTGTPRYMAPEQATFNALDVDTRADIYALGVILYELLTGSTPIPRDSIRRTALDEMLRVIREVEPPTPSSRISTSEGLPGLAANRHVEPSRLSRLVKGDLDWIVMKALAKERDRRYDSAIGMANDVERYLNHEPVTAGPPGAAYRVRKFVRRHRGQVVAASLVLMMLVVGVVGTTLGLIEARRQEQRARLQERIAVAEALEKEKARRAEAEQRAKADASRQQAEKRLAQVAKMNDILGSIFKDLDPRHAEKDGKPLAALLGERLDRASAEIEGEATGDPLVVAEMQNVLGESLLGLGYAEKAIGVLTRARATRSAILGTDHPDTLGSMSNLAGAYQDAGQPDRALSMYEEVLAARRAKLGPDHPDTLDPMNNLAGAYQAAGQLDRALPMFEEVLAASKAKLGPDHPNTLAFMSNLATAYQAAGQLDLAASLLGEFAAIQKRKEGADSPRYAAAEASLGLALLRQEKWADAESALREALTIRERKEPDLWSTFNARSLLGGALLGQKRLEEAEPLLRTGYEGLKQRAAKMPAYAKKYALEALDRLIAFGEATDKIDEVKAWKAERAKLTAPPSNGKRP